MVIANDTRGLIRTGAAEITMTPAIIRPRPISGSVLSLVGDTPTIPYPGRPGRYLKLESFNPTWTIADRLMLNATVDGSAIHFAGEPEVCASAALLGCALQLPVTFEATRPSPSLLIARALGGHEVQSAESTLRISPAAAMKMLVEEIRAEIAAVSAVIIAADSPLRCAIDEIDGISIIWAQRADDDGGEQHRLARAGVFIDPGSAACFAACTATMPGPVVAVAAGGGALACASPSPGGR